MIIIKKGINNSMTLNKDILEIEVKDFSYLLMNDIDIVKEFILKNNVSVFSDINLSLDEIANMIVSDNILEQLNKNNISLAKRIYFFSLKKIYIEYKKRNRLLVTADKYNLFDILNYCNKIDKNVFINGESISMYEYERILSCCDRSVLENRNIKISYQDKNSACSLKELYDTSIKINSISADIEKYGFSPLESIMYVYDMLECRNYNESNLDMDASRDLHKVLFGDSIVCVGYSNIMIAILRNLNIRAMPLVIPKTCKRMGHQRCLVYVDDDKYNIHGVFVFDPTFDRRTTNKPQGGYDYFGISVAQSENEMNSDIYPYLSMSLEDIISRLKTEEIFREKIKSIFDLIDLSFYDEFMNSLDNYSNDLYDLYEMVFDAYSQDDIDLNTKNLVGKAIIKKVNDFNKIRRI